MKWLWKKMWLGLLEALTEWLAKEGKQVPKDRSPYTPAIVGGTKPTQPTKAETVGKQAHEILKGQR